MRKPALLSHKRITVVVVGIIGIFILAIFSWAATLLIYYDYAPEDERLSPVVGQARKITATNASYDREIYLWLDEKPGSLTHIAVSGGRVKEVVISKSDVLFSKGTTPWLLVLYTSFSPSNLQRESRVKVSVHLGGAARTFIATARPAFLWRRYESISEPLSSKWVLRIMHSSSDYLADYRSSPRLVLRTVSVPNLADGLTMPKDAVFVYAPWHDTQSSVVVFGYEGDRK